MEQAKNETTSVALETIITNAVKIPGVKVNRSKFLAEIFAGDDIDLQTIIDMGPVSAGIPQERILAEQDQERKARKRDRRRIDLIAFYCAVIIILVGINFLATI